MIRFVALLFILLFLISSCDDNTSGPKLEESSEQPTSAIEIQDIPVVNNQATFTLFTPTYREEFLLIPYSLNRFGANSTLTISKSPASANQQGSSVPIMLADDVYRRDPELFFRDLEQKLIEQAANRIPISPTEVDDLNVRSLEFWIFSDLGVVQQIRINAGREYNGKNSEIFLDDEANDLMVSLDFTEQLGKTFDKKIYPRIRDVFGKESDIDHDKKVTVLVSPKVNRLGLLGYFNPADVLPGIAPQSNERDMIYVAMPGIETGRGERIGRTANEVTTELMKGVMAHEFQHLVNFNQHAFVFRGSSAEAMWLNEALSHVAEDVVGFGDDRNTRIQYYFEAPENFSVTNFNSPTGSLGERGAAYLFVRYLVDQFGESILTRLTQTNLTGVENVEGVTGMAYGELYRLWATAVYLSNAGLTAADSLNYRSINLRDIVPEGPATTALLLGEPNYTGTIKAIGLRYFILKDTLSDSTVINMTSSGRSNELQVRVVRIK